MKSNDFLSEDIATDAHDMSLDHEVQMARKDCYAAADDAIALHKLLRNVSEQQGLEGWVAAKITLASDYLNTVREHLEYQLMSQVQPEAMELPMAEGAMPASVIKVKEKIRLMSDAEKKDYFKGKSKEQLQKMARSHGYGENSNVYAQHATEEVTEAKGLHKKVKIVKGPDSGKTGYIRQIEHGQYKGAPKKFDVDIEGGGQANGLPAAALRLLKDEQGVAEGSSSHAELAKMAHDAYVAATRKGNGPMAAHYLKQHLKHKADAAKEKSSMAEDELNTDRMNKPHQDFYSKNPHFKRDDKEVVAQGGKLATKVSPSGTKQVTKKPATPFGKTVAEDASGGASGAGSVASVNNPGGKPKSQVGSLFGGTFQREGEDAKPAKKAKAKLSK